jgi:GNAT superfamily N-acetyltransferase
MEKKCQAKNPATCRNHGLHFNSPEMLTNAMKEKFPRLEMRLVELGERLLLEYVIVPKHSRGQGVGREVLEHITRYADEKHLTVELEPDDVFGTPIPFLVQFYKKFGFRPHYVRFNQTTFLDSMVREPAE